MPTIWWHILYLVTSFHLMYYKKLWCLILVSVCILLQILMGFCIILAIQMATRLNFVYEAAFHMHVSSFYDVFGQVSWPRALEICGGLLGCCHVFLCFPFLKKSCL